MFSYKENLNRSKAANERWHYNLSSGFYVIRNSCSIQASSHIQCTSHSRGNSTVAVVGWGVCVRCKDSMALPFLPKTKGMKQVSLD